MSTPISKDLRGNQIKDYSVGPDNEGDYSTKEMLEYFDWDTEEVSGEEGLGFQGMAPGVTANAVRMRIAALEHFLKQNSGDNLEINNQLQAELDSLDGQINYSQALDPARGEAMLSAINSKLAIIEQKCFRAESSGQADLDGVEDQDSEVDPKAVKKQIEKAQEKLESLNRKGAISETVYETMKGRLERLKDGVQAASSAKDKKELSQLAQMVGEAVEAIDLMASDFTINGEVLKTIPGDKTQAEKDADIKSPMLDDLKAAGGLDTERILEKLKTHFPEEFKKYLNGEGELDKAGFQKAVDEKAFPPEINEINGLKLVQFFVDINPKLKDAYNAIPTSSGWSGTTAVAQIIADMFNKLGIDAGYKYVKGFSDVVVINGDYYAVSTDKFSSSPSFMKCDAEIKEAIDKGVYLHIDAIKKGP